MAVIKSSKIFISIRHPHATSIINAHAEGRGNFYHSQTLPLRHHIPCATRRGRAAACVSVFVSTKWSREGATFSNSQRGGQRPGSSHSGTSFSHLHSRCAGLHFHWPDSLGVLLFGGGGKQHLEFAHYQASCFLWWVCCLLLRRLRLFFARLYLKIPASPLSRVSEACLVSPVGGRK